MKSIIIAILLLILFPLELVAIVASLGIYVIFLDGQLISKKLVDKL